MQTTPHTDRELVTLALEGSQPAFSRLMQRYQAAIRSHIQRQFSLNEVIDDLLIDIFHKAFRNLGSYDPRFAFTTWLYTIAENTCIDYTRKKKALNLASRKIYNEHTLRYSENMPTMPDPESEMIASQEAELLIQQIRLLKPIYREPIRLRYLHDYAYEEIASKLSIPTGTVKTRLHRAKELLTKWAALS